jgi:hypothetical protein
MAWQHTCYRKQTDSGYWFLDAGWTANQFIQYPETGIQDPSIGAVNGAIPCKE